MTQTISLYYSDTIRSGLTEVHPNIFFILPPEILALILKNVSEYVNKSIVILMLTCKGFRNGLLLSASYIERLSVNRNIILWLFTGIKHLNIRCGEVNLNSFPESIWKNLESLTLPRRCVERLEESRYTESYLRTSIIDLSNSSCYMSKLRSLKIYSREYEPDPIKLNIYSFLNLKKLELGNCIISNLSDFKSLEELILTDCMNPSVEILNKLNISSLTLNRSLSGTDLENINIPTLRCLTLKNDGLELRDLENLKIDTLTLDCIEIVDLPNMHKMINLRTLIMDGGLKIRYGMNISSNSFPVLQHLRVIKYANMKISASRLVDIYVDECMDITISENLSRHVKHLRLLTYGESVKINRKYH